MNSFDDAQEKQKTKKLDRLFRNFRVLNHQAEPKPNRLVQAGCGVFTFFSYITELIELFHSAKHSI